MAHESFSQCCICPRSCGADRLSGVGVCGVGSKIRVARAALHMWEEPCITGQRGSGTVFFSGCPLGCVYCQNSEISRGGKGLEITPDRLSRIFLELEQAGAHNINLVTPMHFTPQVIRALEAVKPRISVPVAVNTGGYDNVETLRMWHGLADIWMPDIKYCDSTLAARYSHAPDYPEIAFAALAEMHRQQPRLVLQGGLLRQGLLVRHLVLPGAYRDSQAVLHRLNATLPKGSFLLSLMRQFTPTIACHSFPEINRRVTSLEYDKTAALAMELGFEGYIQGKEAADEGFVPEFDFSGVPDRALPDYA